jgi:uncharacterized protein
MSSIPFRVLSRRRMIRGSVAVAILLIVWLAICSVVTYQLTHRSRARFNEPVPNVTWGRIEEQRLLTRDGQDIGAWFVDGTENGPSVLLLHGNKGSRRNSLKQAEFLARAGNSVLMISFRAHGDSSGALNDMGFSACRDVVAAVEFLERRRPGRPVVVMGISMGSAAAIFASSELGHRVSGYILESPYQDLKTAVRNRTEVYLPPLLAQISYLGMRLVGPLFLPQLDQISPLRAIDGIPAQVPVLILAGDADGLARPAEAQALYRRVESHGRLLRFPSANHHTLSSTDPGLYRRTILDFCQEICGAINSSR